MEDQAGDTQTLKQQDSAPQTTTSVVAPKRKRARKKGKFLKPILFIIVLLVAFGGGAWFLLREPQINEGDVSDNQELTTPEFQEPTQTPTPTAEPISREEIRIQVLNGTGIPKEAGFLQGKLGELGYNDIEVGNASDQENVRTEVTFSKSLSEMAINEITEELEDIYADVRSSTSSSLDDFDVVIITGYKIGFTPAPTATEAPTPTPEATGTVTPTPSPTPTPTSTP